MFISYISVFYIIIYFDILQRDLNTVHTLTQHKREIIRKHMRRRSRALEQNSGDSKYDAILSLIQRLRLKGVA